MSRSHRRVVVAYPHAPAGTCKHCGKPTGDRSRAHESCKQRFAERARYAAEAEKREGKHQRCVDCHKTSGEWAYDPKAGRRVQLKVARDHVVALALFGPHDWTAPRCQLCHRDKTKGDNRRAKAVRDERAARKAGRQPGGPMGKGNTVTKHRRSHSGRRDGGTSYGMVALGALMVAAGVGWALRAQWAPALEAWWEAHLVSALALTLMGVLTLGALTVGRWWWRRRRAHRDDALYRLRFLLAKETRTDPNEIRVKATRWEHAVPVAGQAWYSELFDDNDPTERERIEGKVAHKLGRRLTFDWTPSADTVRWAPAPAEAPAGELDQDDGERGDVDRHGKVRERVDGAVRSAIKGDVTLAWGKHDAVGPVSFTVEYPSSYNDESDETRQNLADRVNAKAPGRWRAVWDTEQNVVRFERRPAMPRNVPTPVATDEDSWRLPFGVDEHNAEVAWNLKDAPHALIAGGTGSGKSVLLRSVIQAAVARGMVVFCADPKRVELVGFREWPGVRVVASEPTEMIALVSMVADEMDARYAAIEHGDVSSDHLTPVLLVVDEVAEFILRANAWWKAHKQAGMTGTEHPVVERWRSMARLGRSGRIHLLVGIQRPDAKLFGGEARDNYGFRVSLGPISEQGAKMMYGRADVGRDVPVDAKGRATVGIGEDKALEAQVYNTPNPQPPPDQPLTEAEVILLGRLRELAAAHASGRLPHITADTVAERAQEMADDPAGRQQRSQAPRKPRRGNTGPPAPAQPRPEPEPWQPVPAAVLSEDEWIRIEVKGVLTEVQVEALGEAPDDEDVTEIEWRAPDGRAGVESVGPDEVVDRRKTVPDGR